jgi:hypothetical protein
MTYNTGTGVSTDAQTTGATTVTINSIPAGIGSPIPNGYGMLVETTTTLNTYTFHRLVPIATEVTTVASISGDITTVAGQISPTNNISTVAGISSDIQTLADIEDGTVATNAISNVGNNIGSVTTTASNIASVNNFANVYRISSSAPTTSLDTGDLYFDTTVNELKVYGASGWQAAGSSVNGTSQRYNYTATNAQTTFTGADNNGNTLTYDAGYIDVYLNGVKLLNGTDVTVSSGSSVVLASGATTGDVVDIVAYGTFSVASLNADNLDSGTVPDARITGAYTGITGLTITSSAPKLIIQDTGTHGTNSAPRLEFKDGSSIQGFVEFADDGTMRIDQLKAYPLTFLTNNVERMRITSSGNVGINTTAPSTKLTIDEGGEPPAEGMLLLQANSSSRQLRIQPPTNTDNGFIDYRGGNLTFLDDGTEVARFQGSTGFEVTGTIKVSDGIYLGGTGTANKLDDYEEGTFTPDVYHESSDNSTFSNVNGEYTKIGNTVTCQIRVDSGTTGTAGSDLVIGGLPFAVNQAQGNMGIGSWGSNPSEQVGNVFGFNPPKLTKGGTTINTQMSFVTITLIYKTNA